MMQYKKLLSTVGALLTVIVALTVLHNWIDNKGYTRAIQDVSKKSAEEIAKATADAIADAEIRIAEAQKNSRILFDAELAEAKSTQTVEIKIKEVIRDVEKIKYVNNCGKLTDTSIELLNKTISQVNSPTKD